MAQYITIYDVARETGISPRTVSRYFNHPGLLATETRNRIAAEIARTGFRPSALANQLSSGRVDALAVLASASSGLLGDLHRLLLGHLSLEVARHSRDLLLIGVDAGNEERVIAGHIRQRKLGGLLLLTPIHGRLLEEIAAAALPTVSINWRPGPVLPGNRYVGIDYQASAREYITALLQRRPGSPVLYLCHATDSDRHLGIAAGAAAAGVTCRRIEAAGNADAGLQAVLAAATPGTLVVCWSDHVALALLASARRAGVDVPGRFSLAGFDGLDAGAMMHPVLTTAVQPWQEMAHQAAHLLIEAVEPADAILPISVRWGDTC